MDIFEKLPPEEVELINGYINRYGGGDESDSYMPLDKMAHWLRFWNTSKAPLYQMFGEKFILKKEIFFEKDQEAMEEELDEAIRYGDGIASGFRNGYSQFVQNLPVDYELKYAMKQLAFGTTEMIRNIYEGDPITIPGSITIDGRPLQINHGAKTIKMLGKVCKAIGYTYTAYKCPQCGHIMTAIGEDECPCCGDKNPIYEKIDGYENFRRLHSLVLNQKKLKGNMCLSIHPLDYITMSDNDCGWQSCMQWMEEQGDYRLGTIEMMNSPYCVVAYVEAREPMSLWSIDKKWNSKRWRQLLMITPEMLLGNKQYPYFSDDLQGTAMKWLRELANAGDYRCSDNNKRYGPYEEEALQIANKRHNRVGTRDIYVNFWFTYMYCDIYDYRMAFIASNCLSDRIEYNLSGPAVCTNCGEVIYKDYNSEVEAYWTTCRGCNDMWQCCHCGEWHHGDAYYAEDSDDPYCWYCYEHQTERCEVCGDRVSHTETIYIEVLPRPDEEHECYNWNYIIDACNYCVRNSDFKDLFGEIVVRTDMFGRERQAVLLENISDEGLEHGNLDINTINTLKSIRDAKSDEEKLNLVKKNLY